MLVALYLVILFDAQVVNTSYWQEQQARDDQSPFYTTMQTQTVMILPIL
jgi:hypothetical protein